MLVKLRAAGDDLKFVGMVESCVGRNHRRNILQWANGNDVVLYLEKHGQTCHFPPPF